MTVEARVGLWDGAAALARAEDVWAVYDPVFGDQPSREAWLDTTWRRHCARAGFRCAVAEAEGRVVGFAYGYVGERGQYWPDRVVAALPAPVADEWVGGHFELVSIGVLEKHRGEGLGGLLHDAVLVDTPADRALLGTDAGESPAVALYRSRGWTTLGLLEPGVQVMGLRLGTAIDQPWNRSRRRGVQRCDASQRNGPHA